MFPAVFVYKNTVLRKNFLRKVLQVQPIAYIIIIENENV